LVNLYQKFKKLNKIIYNKYLIKGLINGIAATTEHISVLKLIDNPNTVIDIGANKGQFTLITRHILPKAKIISFEPLASPANKFDSLFNNDSNVIFYRSAIGPEKKSSLIHVSKRNDSSSLLPIGIGQSNIFPGTDESHTEKVKVAPLHHFLQKNDFVPPVFVKIDVQGYELQVLKGCDELTHLFNYIYVECSFMELYEKQALAHEVITFLNSRSFHLKGIYNTFYDKKGIPIQSDFLFERVDESI
jgi:FkbM family methyltransferase